ncbi:hypothetical protein [Actibacterium lipolyticum]|uniref:Uncharacterized protein n=1 Tax=Actibacterium lipolyticum TaxID=1524263 RepID=A0A238JLA4_9RHOB|nr:hypothetical protein [Actibacterium lipolyticum]SMX31421.1 hypothetical protein COL8621_00438 [Actibacterium lipolyticum]
MKISTIDVLLAVLGLATALVFGLDAQIHLIAALSNFVFPGLSFAIVKLFAIIPTVFAVLLAARLLYFLFRPFMHRAAWVVALAVPVGVVTFLPYQVNRVIDVKLAELSAKSIGEPPENLTAEVVSLQGWGEGCDEICSWILVTGRAREVVSLANDGLSSAAHRIDLVPGCTPPKSLSLRMQKRMRLSNLCIVPGQATPAHAEMMLSWRTHSEKLDEPVGILQIAPGQIQTSTTEVATVENGQTNIIFRRTETQAEHLQTPLILVSDVGEHLFQGGAKYAKYHVARRKTWPLAPTKMKPTTSFIDKTFARSVTLPKIDMLKNAREQLRRAIEGPQGDQVASPYAMQDFFDQLKKSDQFEKEDAELLLAAIQKKYTQGERWLEQAAGLAAAHDPALAKMFRTEAMERLEYHVDRKEDISREHAQVFSHYTEEAQADLEPYLAILEQLQYLQTAPNLVKVLAYAGRPALAPFFAALDREFARFDEQPNAEAANNIVVGLCLLTDEYPQEVTSGLVTRLSAIPYKQRAKLLSTTTRTLIRTGWSREQIIELIWGPRWEKVHDNTINSFDYVVNKAIYRSQSENIRLDSICY